MRHRIADIDIDGDVRTRVLLGDEQIDGIVVEACALGLKCGQVTIAVSTDPRDTVLSVARESSHQ
jgi:hypothetical protein